MPSKHGLDPFYNSKRWRRVAAAYLTSKNYLCERCGQPATICHHRRWLNGENVQDLDTALSWDNLEALCQDCHNAEHAGKEHRRVIFDAAGNVTGVQASSTSQAYQTQREQIDGVLTRAESLFCGLMSKEKGQH